MQLHGLINSSALAKQMPIKFPAPADEAVASDTMPHQKAMRVHLFTAALGLHRL
jgi:hypothetical protein